GAVTKFLSLTALSMAMSAYSPPAERTSGAQAGYAEITRPRTTSAAVRIWAAWQIAASGLFACAKWRTQSSTFLLSRRYSGALPPGRRGGTRRHVQSQPIRAAAANLKPRRRSSRRPGGFLPAHAEDLLHAGDRFAVLVEHRDLEGRVDLSLGVRLGADLLDAL